MITPREALDLVRRHCRPLGAHVVPIDEALDCVLAENVKTPFPMPRFDNSAMDGFAIRSSDTDNAVEMNPVRLKIADTVFAGRRGTALRRGETCRIMTGARMPKGADTVVPVENAITEGGHLIVAGPVEESRHVRYRGEEVRSGARILEQGTHIHPGVIAALASVGRDEVKVVRRPRVALISTGDETVAPGGDLGESQIYDSNSPMIVALLRQMGIEAVRVRQVSDKRGALLRAVRSALEHADVLITTGGVSMGEHDYLRPVLGELGVKEVFWRVSQKPGKPLYFGVKGINRVFGLPGNPASAFVCFYVYVYPALRRMSGLIESDALVEEALAAEEALSGDAKRWQLLRGKSKGEGVSKLSGQGSHMVTALAQTDRLIVVPPGTGRMEKGIRFTTIRLPHAEEDGR
jgi:molybdopterin molybdotransferase